jgi:sugar phosphate isomerase/epimerase
VNNQARFRLALNASTIRPTPLLRKIEIAARAGYGGIELWHEEIDAFLAGGGSLAQVRAALDNHNLAVPTTIYIGGWFDCPDTHWPDVLDRCRRRMDQAAALGARHVIAGPPAGRADVVVGARRYRTLLEEGLERGVRPAFEFLGFVEQICTIEAALEIVTLAGHPAATIVLDPFHVFRGGGSFEGLSKLRATQIAISHFNDTPAEPPREQQHDRHRVMPGDGHLDLRRYLELLRRLDYDGWLSLELFSETLRAQDPLTVARTGLERMQAQIAAIPNL